MLVIYKGNIKNLDPVVAKRLLASGEVELVGEVKEVPAEKKSRKKVNND